MPNNIFCSNCGTEYSRDAKSCPKCAHPNKDHISYKSNLVAFLLCFFIGGLGVHRMYVGKVGSGIAILLLSVFLIGYIWVFVDLIMIITSSFTDKNGSRLKW